MLFFDGREGLEVLAVWVGLLTLGVALLMLGLIGALSGSWFLLIVGLVWGFAFLYPCRGSRHLVGLGSVGQVFGGSGVYTYIYFYPNWAYFYRFPVESCI